VELIIFVGALCIVSGLAMRFGHDSRIPAHSKEQDHANLGLSWGASDQIGENTIPNMRRGVCRFPASRRTMDPYSYR
jgi:hypothetical protein